MLVTSFIQFNGISTFDNGNIDEICNPFIDSWSIHVITLTCIAISIHINKSTLEYLLDGVSEGLSIIFRIEKCFGAVTSEELWEDVYTKHVWLGKSLKQCEFTGLSTREIIQSFIEISQPNEQNRSYEEELWKLNAATTMYRVANTILANSVNYTNVFDSVCDMISDLLSASLTNIPALISLKCENCEMEQRDKAIKFATKLVGKTTDIIDFIGIRGHHLPKLSYDRYHSISEWRSYFQSMPTPFCIRRDLESIEEEWRMSCSNIPKYETHYVYGLPAQLPAQADVPREQNATKWKLIILN